LKLGSSLTTLTLVGSYLGAMYKLNERNVINSIEFVKSGEHQGKFKINVSTSILQSKDLIADIGNI